MRRSILLGAAVSTSIALVFTACSSDDGGGSSEAEVIADVSEDLQRNGLDEAVADCQAQLLVDEIGVDALKDLDLSADEPPGGMPADIAAATISAAEECDQPASGG